MKLVKQNLITLTIKTPKDKETVNVDANATVKEVCEIIIIFSRIDAHIPHFLGLNYVYIQLQNTAKILEKITFFWGGIS